MVDIFATTVITFMWITFRIFICKNCGVIGEYFASRGVTIDWCEDEDSRNHLYEDEGHFGTNFCQGYIDHQSGPREDSDSMEIARMFRDDAEALYNFCFGGGSSIITDNDNH